MDLRHSFKLRLEEFLLVQKVYFYLCKQHLFYFSNIHFNKIVVLFIWKNVRVLFG
ncbi:unnamed protein product, partial [Brassica oleracea]